jgi:hypothetical protein
MPRAGWTNSASQQSSRLLFAWKLPTDQGNAQVFNHSMVVATTRGEKVWDLLIMQHMTGRKQKNKGAPSHLLSGSNATPSFLRA